MSTSKSIIFWIFIILRFFTWWFFEMKMICIMLENTQISKWAYFGSRDRVIMVGTAFEISDVFLFKTCIFMIVRTHPEELRGLKVHVYEKVEIHFKLLSGTRSSSVWVLTTICFCGSKSMNFELFKSVSGIVPRHLNTF